MKQGNLFASIPDELSEELFEPLAEGEGRFRIERIVSRGHRSPDGFWYESESTEWVALLRGSALLRFEQESEPVALAPGDWCEIPARCRHRVEATAPDEDSVWLAVHWD